MRIRLWSIAALMAITLIGPATRGQAQDLDLASDYDSSDVPIASDSIAASYAEQSQAPPAPNIVTGPAEEVTTPAPGDTGAVGTCGTCGNCCSTCKCGPYSEPCPKIGSYFFSGIDSFRGITSGTYPGNNGAVTGLNLAGALWADRGIGWQAGGSYGVYNFSGRTSPGAQLNETTQQGFFTIGIFRRAGLNHRFSWGLVHDWMLGNNFGVFGSSPTLAQFRGQAAWALSDKNEIGVWATVYDRTATFATGALGTPVMYRAIDQGNLFWHHKYASCGADSWFYIGIPLDRRLQQTSGAFPVGGAGGSLGSAIVGTNWTIPISDRLSGYANAMYMAPSAHAGVSTSGAAAASQEFWNFSMGLAWYPARAARSQTVAGRQWMPYMPVANNSSFLVDSNKTE